MTFAWVIEKRDSDPSRPVYFTGRHHPAMRWSDPGDHEAACRFSRRQDADAVAGYIWPYEHTKRPHRICEHGWDEPEKRNSDEAITYYERLDKLEGR